MEMTKQVVHLGVRFYRTGGVEMVLVPLIHEVSGFTRSAGDGYFLVSLMGEPGTAYPVDLRSPGSFDPDYLERKFKLDRRGYSYSPEELAAALRAVSNDVAGEMRFDE